MPGPDLPEDGLDRSDREPEVVPMVDDPVDGGFERVPDTVPHAPRSGGDAAGQRSDELEDPAERVADTFPHAAGSVDDAVEDITDARPESLGDPLPYCLDRLPDLVPDLVPQVGEEPGLLFDDHD